MMERTRAVCLSCVRMLSESLWVYFTIVLFTGVEWGRSAFYDATPMAAAAISAYAVNGIFLKKGRQTWQSPVNGLLLAGFAAWNWMRVVPEGAWGFGVAASAGIVFAYIRGAVFALQKAERQNLLRCFEGNIVFYMLFAGVFAVKGWNVGAFHLMFVTAILSSLMGMILALQNQESPEGGKSAKVVKAGEPGWFAGLLAGLLAAIPLAALALVVLPTREVLAWLGDSLEMGLKGILSFAEAFVEWIRSLLPAVEMDASVVQTPDPAGLGSGAPARAGGGVPYGWMAAAGLGLLSMAAVLGLTGLNRRRASASRIQKAGERHERKAWWKRFAARVKSGLQTLLLGFRRRFPGNYRHQIFWQHRQVLEWGRRNGYPKADSETSREYAERLSNRIPESEDGFTHEGRRYRCTELLEMIAKDFQSVYYGREGTCRESGAYDALVRRLKALRLS